MPDPQNTFEHLNPEGSDGEKRTKIILLSGFSDKQLHDLIDAYRSDKKFPKAIFATVTEQSLKFRVADLLAELELEKKQIDAAKDIGP